MTDRVVLITGGSSGIGLASAVAFAELDDHVVLVSRSPAALATAAALCENVGSGRVDTIAADVGATSDVEAMIARTLELHDRIDVVVHSATVMAYGTIEDLPEQVFQQVVDTAIHSTAHLGRQLLPVLRRQHRGTLIVVNSLLGSVTVPRMGAYATAKWGQLGLCRVLQQEVRDERDVHVCIVSPGSINTPIYYQAANVTGRAARPPWPVLPPERVAASIVRLADRPRRQVSLAVGPGNPAIVAGFRFAPFLYDRLVGPLFGLLGLTHEQISPTDGNVLAPQPRLERRGGHWPDRG